MNKCCGCWAHPDEAEIYRSPDGDYYCKECAVKAADEAYKNMAYTEQYDIFIECFGQYADKEVFETFFDDFDDDEKLEAMGFEEIGE